MTVFSHSFKGSDQADGLRRLFAAPRQQIVPVAANRQVDCAGVLMERLSLAFSNLGAHVFVIDAADSSPQPHELVDIDLPSCIERLGSGVHYLAARGLPRRHVNTECVPQADVVIVHAEARDLCRLLGRREVAPVLLSELSSESLTEAYASMKLLSQRCGLMAFDLLVGMASRPRRAERVADRLASCADNFLSAVLRSWAPVDRDLPITAPVSTELERLAANQLTGLEGHSALSLPAAGAGRGLALALD
jgi:flagellar biosynthesis protein FlhG